MKAKSLLQSGINSLRILFARGKTPKTYTHDETCPLCSHNTPETRAIIEKEEKRNSSFPLCLHEAWCQCNSCRGARGQVGTFSGVPIGLNGPYDPGPG